MPTVVIDKMLGLNTTRASLQLQAGESSTLQNIWPRPTENLSKRRGIEPVSESTEPIWGIMAFEFDDGTIIPLIQNSNTLEFNPDLTSASLPNGLPENIGRAPDDDGSGGSFVLFQVEKAMRAMASRAVYVSPGAVMTWPGRRYNYDGTTHAVELPGNYPPNGFYAYDLAWSDEKEGNPYGTFAAGLVNQVRYEINRWLGYYFNRDLGLEGKDQPYAWTSVTLPLPPVAQTNTYRQTLVTCKEAIRKLSAIFIQGSYISSPSGWQAYQGLTYYNSLEAGRTCADSWVETAANPDPPTYNWMHRGDTGFPPCTDYNTGVPPWGLTPVGVQFGIFYSGYDGGRWGFMWYLRKGTYGLVSTSYTGDFEVYVKLGHSGVTNFVVPQNYPNALEDKFTFCGSGYQSEFSWKAGEGHALLASMSQGSASKGYSVEDCFVLNAPTFTYNV